MTTVTGNHLMVSTNFLCIAGPFIGETASFTLRFCVNSGSGVPAGRPDLNAGQISLNTFDCHTSNATRAKTISSVPGTVAEAWVGDDAPASEQVTGDDIDFFLTLPIPFLETTKAYWSADWQMRYTKLYQVREDGKAPLGPCTWTPDVVYKGTTGSYLSPEVAACVSLYTAHRARSGRGRFFFGPVMTSIMDTKGLFISGGITALGNGAQTMFNSVRSRGTPGVSATYTGIVWNRHPTGSSSGPGTTGCVINRVRVGDEPDHQERRTKSRPETFVDKPIS